MLRGNGGRFGVFLTDFNHGRTGRIQINGQHDIVHYNQVEDILPEKSKSHRKTHKSRVYGTEGIRPDTDFCAIAECEEHISKTEKPTIPAKNEKQSSTDQAFESSQ